MRLDVDARVRGWTVCRVLEETASGMHEAVAEDDAGAPVLLRVPSNGAEILRVRAEADLARRHKHERIVQTVGVVEHCGWPVQVIEYADGMTLERVALLGGRLAPAAVCRIGWQIATALSELHAQTFHGALSADRVVIDERGNVRLADLGRVRPEQQPRLMSPERRAAMGAASVADDLYALGGLLAEAALGRALDVNDDGYLDPRGLVGLPQRLTDALTVLLAREGERLTNAAAAVRVFGQIEDALGNGARALQRAVEQARFGSAFSGIHLGVGADDEAVDVEGPITVPDVLRALREVDTGAARVEHHRNSDALPVTVPPPSEPAQQAQPSPQPSQQPQAVLAADDDVEPTAPGAPQPQPLNARQRQQSQQSPQGQQGSQRLSFASRRISLEDLERDEAPAPAPAPAPLLVDIDPETEPRHIEPTVVGVAPISPAAMAEAVASALPRIELAPAAVGSPVDELSDVAFAAEEAAFFAQQQMQQRPPTRGHQLVDEPPRQRSRAGLWLAMFAGAVVVGGVVVALADGGVGSLPARLRLPQLPAIALPSLPELPSLPDVSLPSLPDLKLPDVKLPVDSPAAAPPDAVVDTHVAQPAQPASPSEPQATQPPQPPHEADSAPAVDAKLDDKPVPAFDVAVSHPKKSAKSKSDKSEKSNKLAVADKPEKPAEKVVEKPTEKVAEKPAEKVVEKPAEAPGRDVALVLEVSPSVRAAAEAKLKACHLSSTVQGVVSSAGGKVTAVSTDPRNGCVERALKQTLKNVPDGEPFEINLK